jgi:hypothetical protein
MTFLLMAFYEICLKDIFLMPLVLVTFVPLPLVLTTFCLEAFGLITYVQIKFVLTPFTQMAFDQLTIVTDLF